MAQGDFAAHLDADLASQALAGAILYRRVLTDSPLARNEIPGLVATVLGPA